MKYSITKEDEKIYLNDVFGNKMRLHHLIKSNDYEIIISTNEEETELACFTKGPNAESIKECPVFHMIKDGKRKLYAYAEMKEEDFIIVSSFNLKEKIKEEKVVVDNKTLITREEMEDQIKRNANVDNSAAIAKIMNNINKPKPIVKVRKKRKNVLDKKERK
jgi:hypothetical protein